MSAAPLLRRAALIAALVAVPAAAYAQTDAQVAAARAAFKEGDEAEKRRDLPTALAKFKEALAVKETPQLILRIGGVQEKLGQLGQAMLSYERGLERAQASNLAPVVKVVKEQIDALRPRVPTVVVTVAKQYPDLAVTLDDKPLALGTKLYLDPGEHKIVARATGYDTKEKPFAATERDALEFQLDLAPTGGVVPPVGGPPAGETAGASSDKPSRLPSVILISGGGGRRIAAGRSCSSCSPAAKTATSTSSAAAAIASTARPRKRRRSTPTSRP